MIKKLTLSLLILALSTACVSKKKYVELENEYADLKKENRTIADKNADLEKAKSKLEADLEKAKAKLESEKNVLNTDLGKVKTERDKLLSEIEALKKNLDGLKTSYSDLEKNSGESQKNISAKNKELLDQLTAKEKALALEQEKLNKSAQRLQELEGLIASKEASMKKLKETLSKALNSFEGKGLTVEQKNGKVYVSVENKLLFKSGSWTVNAEGKSAVTEVGKVLGDNPEIAVLIEGHTDDDPFVSSGPIADNWDLSTKRATAIVAILSENKAVKKQNLTAAGRSEFSPLATNSTPEGKAKNRRIEIILTPRLDEIAEMLKGIN